ncbi:MAG: hypothetical protein FWC76_07590 [Defluviitaleaceae bacterium]|nr:hypothetical protein [Defluviitaleaceae bacterium]
MKRIRLLLVAILVATLFILSACQGTTSIIGSWGDDRGTHIRLFDDGSGIWLGNTVITWSADDDILTIVNQDGTEEQFIFHVTGGRLRLYFPNGVLFDTFIRLWR